MNASVTPVRLLTEDDIEWALGIGRLYYEGAYDENSVRLWLYARLKEPGMIFLRSEHAIAVAHLAQRFQMPGRFQAHLILLYSEPGNYGREVLRLMEALKQWALEKKAGKLWFGDVTGHDLGKIAGMIGGRTAGHNYVVDLDGDPKTLG